VPDPTPTDVTSAALVRTDRPARYGKQLVAHLNRRSTGEWDEAAGAGWIQFSGGRAVLTAAAEGLDLRLTAEGAEHLALLEGVVGRHLVRFGTRDELVVRWVRADGAEGTVQEHVAD